MTLQEAIEILRDLGEGTVEQIYNQREDAIKLVIEALKRTKSNREVYWGAAYVPLPGETKGD